MSAELKNIEWFQQQLLTWSQDNLRDYPWRNTKDPYSTLVAEFLLQRTDADTVKPIYDTFLIQYPTLHQLAIVQRLATRDRETYAIALLKGGGYGDCLLTIINLNSG